MPLDSIDNRLDSMSGRLTVVETHLTEHDAILRRLEERIDVLHGLMENLLVRVEHLEQEYVMITAALKRLEARFDKLDAAHLNERIESLEKRVTALESMQN